jgi:nucleoside-diphosphate-sugar epimerase
VRILVTGACGLIGDSTCRELEERGHDVVRSDRKLDCPVLGLDLSASTAALRVVDESEPDVVVHLAASPGRAFAQQHPDRALADGVVATTMVAQACASYGVRMVYASSSEVYGDRGVVVVDEDSETTPTSGLYGLMKLWGEQVCRHYLDDYRLLVVRPLMVYGPGQRVGPGWAALPTFLANAINRVPIEVHSPAMRSWCYVDDVARALAHLVERRAWGTYNVGRDDEEVSMTDVACWACNLAGAPYDLIRVTPASPLQTRIKRVSCQKLLSTGWRPQVPLHEGMRRVYESMLAEVPSARPV